jgi:tetratricopeptide (TPR) repeat protein
LRDTSLYSYASPYQLALIHLLLGERESSLRLLQEAYEIKDSWLVWLGVEPQLDPLRGDPIFESLLKETRNPAPAHRPAKGKVILPSERPISGPITAPVIVAPNTQTGVNEEAQQLFTAGRYYATRRTAEGLRQGIERFERAVELDPQYAMAHAELADCYSLLNWYVEPPPAHAWRRAKESAMRAVQADPDLAEAHASMGFVRLHYDRDWNAAERELRRAIQLKPSNQVAHRWYAYSLSAMGRHEEALSEIRRAREISPQSPVIATAVANVLFLAGKFDEAIIQCRSALDLDSGAVAAHTILRWAYEKKGKAAEAIATFEQERSFAGDTPTTRAKRAHVLAATGHHDEARSILQEIIAKRPDEWVTAYEIAIIYCLLGERDSAFQWLAQAEQEHAVGFTFVRADPHLESLRSDPRFAELLRETDKTIP